MNIITTKQVNRIAIDEATLKHFVADERIKATADKFRAKSKR